MARKANNAAATATPATNNALVLYVAPAATPVAPVQRTPATRAVPSNAYKYGAAHKAIAATGTYTLTAAGRATAATNGAGKSGKVTVMGLVAVAASAVAAKGLPLTGTNIVLAMRTLPAVVAAFGATKAQQYAPRGTLPTHAWCSGYVTGAARTPACLLATA